MNYWSCLTTASNLGKQAIRILADFVRIVLVVEIGADAVDGRQIERRQGQSEARTVGPLNLNATAGQIVRRRRVGR